MEKSISYTTDIINECENILAQSLSDHITKQILYELLKPERKAKIISFIRDSKIRAMLDGL